MRFLRFVTAFTLAFLVASPFAVAQEPVRTLFVGVAGVEAGNVSPGVLNALEDRGAAVMNLHTRTSNPDTCPVDGWMSMRTPGNAVDYEGRQADGSACRPLLDVIVEDGAGTPSRAKVPDFEQITRDVKWPAEPAAGVGIGPGAALSLASQSGEVARWLPAPGRADELGAVVLQALHESHGNVFVDAGWAKAGTNANDPSGSASDVADGGGTSTTAGPTGLSVDEVNARIEAVLAAYTQFERQNPGTVRLVLASVGRSEPGPALQFGAVIAPTTTGAETSATGPASAPETATPGLFYSSATRSAGLATLGDVRDLVAGGPVQVEPKSMSTAHAQLMDEATHALAARGSLTPFFAGWGAFLLVGMLAGLTHFVRKPAKDQGPAWIWRNIAVWNALAFAVVPAAMIANLVPWWRLSTNPLLSILLVFSIAAALLGLARSSSQPVAVLAALTVLLVAVDIASGAHLQRDGFFGSMTLASRRFYGISNRSYVILLASALIATLPWIADRFPQKRQEAARGVAAMGAGVLAIDALPFWGADFGGPAGIIAGFGIAYLMVRGIRPRWRHAAWWVVLTIVAMILAGALDARSTSPSHIGLFWKNFGSPETLTLVADKARDMATTFAGNPLILAAVTAAAILVVVGARFARRLFEAREGTEKQPADTQKNSLETGQIPPAPSSNPHLETLREATPPGLAAVAAGIAVGALVAVPINDSGLLIVVDTVAIAGPALVSILARRLQISRTHCTESPRFDV
ncbi:hypothetical protein [Actinomyces urinae]|uniref:hypothetical protein n=1 Tax=Actinomyces urinae TaxID=1689268 RepID=UPI000ADE9CC2|nr:hypothetical protein [Actinomyces urinae]